MASPRTLANRVRELGTNVSLGPKCGGIIPRLRNRVRALRNFCQGLTDNPGMFGSPFLTLNLIVLD